MSTYSLYSQASVATPISTPLMEQQPQLLEEALNNVKLEAGYMKKCIDANLLYDSLKHASNMLAELRTSTLLPKYYYELYMAIFDELRYLSTYLYDIHVSGTHKLADLYELVQYATNIVPRLYLMITVGSIYMRASNEHYHQVGSGKDTLDESVTKFAPTREIMKDMLDMAGGVQHATRGLFLRYYLSAVTRNYLPDTASSACGDITDSIDFVLGNFVEMNKLWVRLQHQGHSKHKEQREQERRELRLLVGTNLVRLSQLESVTLESYQSLILPSLLDEIVGCRDVIAQEYLFDIIIQAFPDEFHLQCLEVYLGALAKLQPNVNVKLVVVSLIDRFAKYAERVKENGAVGNEILTLDIRLFEVFWEQIANLIDARLEFSIEDIMELYCALNSLALNFYPTEPEYVDRVLGMAATKFSEARERLSDSIKVGETKRLLLQLLLDPVTSYQNDITRLMVLPSGSVSPTLDGHMKSRNLGGSYTDLLYLQPYGNRRQVAIAIAKAATLAGRDDGFTISTMDAINFIFGEVCSVMVRDQVDGNLFGSFAHKEAAENDFKEEVDQPLEWEDAVEEQNLVAKLIHLIKSKETSEFDQLQLLCAVRDHCKEGGEIRSRFTFPPIVISMIKLAKDLRGQEEKEGLLLSIFRELNETIGTLGAAREYFSVDDNYSPLYPDELSLSQSAVKIGRGMLSPPETALQLFLMAAKVADYTNHEEMCYEFYVQAYTVYEESISESKSQLAAIRQIIAALSKSTVFSTENFTTLVAKATIHSTRLLKRGDQCRAILLASHLYWNDHQVVRPANKQAYQESSKVLECLQKAMKIADSILDRNESVALFVEILEEYLWYFENRVDTISASLVNALVELIRSNLANPVPKPEISRLGGPLAAPAPRPISTQTKELRIKAAIHFSNIIKYIISQQEHYQSKMQSVVLDMDNGFQRHGGRWGDIAVPAFDFSNLHHE